MEALVPYAGTNRIRSAGVSQPTALPSAPRQERRQSSEVARESKARGIGTTNRTAANSGTD